MKALKQHIIWQVIAGFLIVIIPALLIIGTYTFSSVSDLYTSSMGEDTRNAADFAKTVIQSNPNYEWLFDFWTENYQEMDLIYDDQTVLNEKEALFAALNPGLSSHSVQPDDLAALDYESQKLYAEICHMEMTLTFDRLKEAYDLRYFYCINLRNESEEFFLLTGVIPGETRGTGSTDVYTLGVTADPALDNHYVLKSIWETRQGQSELEARKTSTSLSNTLFNVYVTLDNRAEGSDDIYIIVSSLDTTDARDLLQDRLTIIQIGTFFALLLAIALMVIVFYNRTIHPVTKMQQTIQQFAESKDLDSLTKSLSSIISQNEIGCLAQDLSNLSTELINYTHEATKLATQQERLNSELELATKIQTGLLPSLAPNFDNRAEFDLFAVMDPAKEVGGDFFDFFQIDDDHLCLVVADVSGKGIPAAMFMMTAMIFIRNSAKHHSKPSEIMEEVNNELCGINNLAGMFMTCWLAIINLKTGHVLQSNAGHEYPAFCKSNGKFELIKEKHNLALAFAEGIHYQDTELTMESGDFLFCYTDGVPEATRVGNEMFGMDRMIDALNINPEAKCEELLSNVRTAVDNFVGDAPQFDDLTMLGIRFYGK